MNRHERRRTAALHPPVRQSRAPAEDIDLVWSVGVQAMNEDKAGERGLFYQVFQDIKRANCFVLTKRVTAMAEDLRISDLGVTINSFEMGVPFPGLTWMEWDAAVEGRDPPLPHQTPYERVGVLIEADNTGHRGKMAVLAKTAPTDGQSRGAATMVPLAMTFDLREDFELPEFIFERPSLDQARRAQAALQDPTPSQMETSAVAAAAMERRFGTIENPYLAAFLNENTEAGEGSWLEDCPDLLAVAGEMAQDGTLALCAFMVARTVAIEESEILAGTRRRVPTLGIDTTPLGYTIIDLAASARSRMAGAYPYRLRNQ